MKRGFVGGGALIAAVLVVAALVVIAPGQSWALCLPIPLVALRSCSSFCYSPAS